MTQLPPRFQPHPECATALLTLEQAIALIQSGDLSITAAQWLFPHAHVLLPKQQFVNPSR